MHKVFFSPEYTSASYSFATTRKADWIADSLGRKPIPGVELVEPSPLTEDVVLGTHSREYVTSLRDGIEPLASSQGFRWCLRMLPAVLSSNGGVLAAARAARESGVSGSLSSGLHHARAGAGMGFCTLNGLAIAASELIRDGAASVVVLDLDAHGGGGTSSLISGNVRIHHLDVAVDPFDLCEETVDRSDATPREYLKAVMEALSSAPKADVCLYNAGMDVHEHDCGPPGFDHRLIAARESLVFSWARDSGTPIAYVLAGGYVSPKRSAAELVAHHRATIFAAASVFGGGAKP